MDNNHPDEEFAPTVGPHDRKTEEALAAIREILKGYGTSRRKEAAE